LLRTQDTPTAVVSRWIAAAGDPDYREAFLTILKDLMTGHRDLINVRSRVRKGDATASRTCDVCRYGVGCGFGVPIDLDPTVLSTGLAGLNPIRDIANVRTTVLLAEAQFNVDNTKWLAGTGTDESWRHLEHRRHRRSHHDAARADRNHGGDPNGPPLGKQVLERSTMQTSLTTTGSATSDLGWLAGQASPSLIVWVLRSS
jgi:hypothetical protein